MQTYDLIGCFLKNMAVIGGENIIKMAVSHGATNVAAFRDIGNCELERVANAEVLDSLLGLYLVWYRPNGVGLCGWHVEDSLNWRLCEYVSGLVNGSITMPDEISHLVQSFKKEGLKKPVEICLAFDTYLSLGLIVDGTKRAVALHYLKVTEPVLLNQLVNAQHPICIFRLNSSHCRILFPCDFLKLCLRTRDER